MKKILLAGAFLLAIFIYVQKPAPRKIRSIAPAAPAPVIPSEAPSPSPEPTSLQDKIIRLESQLADLDHELARADYPKAMLDSRLSDQEREEIVAKVVRASRLHDQILKLRMLEIERSPL